MAIINQIIEMCQGILATPMDHPSKESMYATLDYLIQDFDNETTNAIILELQRLNLHTLLLQDRERYEYEREATLARMIGDTGDASPLESFRSTQWYDDAHLFENAELARYSMNNILMVGSGPYPSTVFSLMDTWDYAAVSCVERSHEACTLSKKVALSLGYGEFCVKHSDAQGVSLKYLDCILVGTVVGVLESEKNAIIQYFLKNVPPGAVLAFRTATGPGRIIYPTIDTSQFQRSDHKILKNPPQKTWTTIIVPPGT